MPTQCPLDARHCDNLDAVLCSTAEVKELLEKCKRCGLDVRDAERENEEHRRLAESLKREFFPERT